MIIRLSKSLSALAVVSVLAACQYQPSTMMRTVYFDSGSSKVNGSGMSVIREVSDVLVMKQSRFGWDERRHDSRIITPAMAFLSGHTDTVGNPAKNKKLSEDRVDAVKKALASHGIKGSALVTSSYGENKLAVQTRDNVKEGKNRRVEIRIVE